MRIFLIFFFILTYSFASADMDKGDLEYVKKNYIKAIEYYTKEYNKGTKKAKLKLIMSYLKLGDNFKKTRNYPKALDWYEKAKELQSKSAVAKIAKIYELQGDQYNKIKDFKKAEQFYKKSFMMGNLQAKNKLEKVNKRLKHQKNLINDTRKIVTDNSPPWTKAVGRLIIPTKLEIISKNKYKTKYKKCSASIINFPYYDSSRVIVTASHCLTSYKKKAGDIRFIIKNNKGKMIQRFAKIDTDSKYSKKKIKTVSDYAILILDKTIKTKEVKPLLVDEKNFVELKLDNKYSFASLAGFSGDIGDFGARLTFDPKCQLSYHSLTYGLSNCSGFKGASGGPVVMSISDDGIKYSYRFVGIVSHFRNRDFRKIYFAPHDIFYDKIKRAIQKYNGKD